MAENPCGKGAADGSTDATDKEFSCDYCDGVFASRVTKRRHEKNYHAAELSHTCPDCGKAFHGRRGLISHHAQKHDGRLAGYDRVCGVCGESFTTSKKSMKYCSPECGSEAQKKRVTVTCEWCDTEFDTIPSKVDDKRFCSLDCKTDWFSDWFTGENHPQYKDNTVSRECTTCETTFEIEEYVLESRNHDRAFCSRECAYEWKSEYWVGENNPLYKGGDNYYGENWHRQRRRALRRDQHRCQDCRATAAELPREPSVHHITPIRDFDAPEAANTLDNLITLCEPCHSKWEGLYLRPDTRGGE